MSIAPVSTRRYTNMSGFNLITYPSIPLNDFVDFILAELQVFLDIKLPQLVLDSTIFNERLPHIQSSISYIVWHLVKYLPCSSECFMIGLIYLYRIKAGQPDFVNSKTVGKLFAVSVMIASKYFDDYNHNNLTYAELLLVDVSKLYHMEHLFLLAITHHCFIDHEEFDKIFHKMLLGVDPLQNGFWTNWIRQLPPRAKHTPCPSTNIAR